MVCKDLAQKFLYIFNPKLEFCIFQIYNNALIHNVEAKINFLTKTPILSNKNFLSLITKIHARPKPWRGCCINFVRSLSFTISSWSLPILYFSSRHLHRSLRLAWASAAWLRLRASSSFLSCQVVVRKGPFPKTCQPRLAG